MSARSLVVTRGGRRLVDRLDLTVAPGSRIGIVGENGVGKSTLLHTLSGDLPSESGSVATTGAVEVVEQELHTGDATTVGDLVAGALEPARAALDRLDSAALALADQHEDAGDRYADALAAAEALSAWDAERTLDVALGALGAETDRSRRLATLSVGQRYRVRLACALGGGADHLLLDEPTNHLDAGGLEFLTTSLRARAGTVVVVSHDRALLRDVVTTIVDLDPTPDGRPRVWGDGWDGYVEGRRAEFARWEQLHAAQQREHRALAEDLERSRSRLQDSWRPGKGTGKHQRATRADTSVRAVHRRVEALERHEVSAPEPPLRFTLPTTAVRGGVVLDAHGVTLSGRLDVPVDLTLTSGDHVLLTGPNGAGKSSLLAVLAGAAEPTSGVVATRTRRIGWLRQESEFAESGTARAVYAAHVARSVSTGVIDASEQLPVRTFGLLAEADLATDVAALSYGRRRRLALAMVLATRPHVLLLDEPSNHLSPALVGELTEALRETATAVVVATHDRAMLHDLADWRRVELGESQCHV
ncbi:ABC-F family ATP-binding cassette domain-containing protein [Rhodococcus rhodnii]|uniref:ABC transporter n=2 Tax=Rhodococcus rhodnii TaxID=38312 RepID=R7WJ62_9NOCA|nr:ATP-binding cassette domain-containing protein [Rhodococcus rhodnii]EOM75297.1 ABC transporter [Rhodococcus rhodnii LMG 5362]